jgi:DNA repair exonuclease SbcCD nuclease subunit
MVKAKVLAVGDQHFKIDNIPLINKFIKRTIDIINDKKPDFVVLLGDLLHTHERIHTLPLNKAYEFIDSVRKLCKTYILVGNHDHINGTQFLTTNHWLNGLKEWDNVIVVDNVLEDHINEEKFIFMPYVQPSRFEEALNTLQDDWKDSICIFAHQEFYNCKMGGILSVEGDKWPLDYPNVISGHIHECQKLQENIYYTGSSLEMSYGQNKENIVAYIEFDDEKNYKLEEIGLKLPRKKIEYFDIENIDDFKVIGKTEDEIKLSLNGNYEEFKSFKKTKRYKELVKEGIKVVFKPKKKNIKIKNEKLSKIINDNTEDLANFSKIISEIILDQKDPYLSEVYELIVNNNTLKKEDILFL